MSTTNRIGRKPRTKEDVNSYCIHQLKNNYEVDENGCWIWQGIHFGNGYGRLSKHLPISDFSARAHIASYQYHIGKIGKGLFVCHSCDVKNCINPNHLWLGTNSDNQKDYVNKGLHLTYWTKERREEQSRRFSGENNPMFGVRGESAPTYGRVGDKHPMFGKNHSEETKDKISISLKRHYNK